MATYKSFFIKAVIFCVLFLVFDQLLGVVFRALESSALKSSPYTMVTDYSMQKVDADMVIVGSSECQYSYIPQILKDSTGLSVHNCGIAGTAFYYQNSVVHGILDRYTPKVILWAITPDFLKEQSESDNSSLSELYPYYNQSRFLKDNIGVVSKYEKLKLLLQSYRFNSTLFTFIYRSLKHDEGYQYGGYIPSPKGGQKDLEIIKRTWEDSFDEQLVKIFSETIERCKNSGVQLVFVLTPRLEEENHDDLTSYKRLKEVLCKYQLPMVEELYHDEDIMKPELFRDTPHPNDAGAHVFSEKLAGKLKTIIAKAN